MQKAVEQEVDGLILVCAGAGGHAEIYHLLPYLEKLESGMTIGYSIGVYIR